MFNFDILLFMFSMWMTIINCFDCNHVSIDFQCIHTYMLLLWLLVWRTMVCMRTGRWCMYGLQSGNTEGIGGLGYEEGCDYINRRVY